MYRTSLIATYLFQIHKGAIYMLRNHSRSGKNSGLEVLSAIKSGKHNVHARVGDEYDCKQVDILISKNQVLHILAT